MGVLLEGHADPSNNRSIGQQRFRLTLQRPLPNQKLDLAKRKVVKAPRFACWAQSLVCTCKGNSYRTTGFVEEMRFVAMKLHTKDQAPKEGGKAAAPQPFQKVPNLVAVLWCNWT